MAQVREFESLTPIKKAMSDFLKDLRLTVMPTVQVSIREGLGRVLAENIVADEDLPSFARSAVDGYAVRAYDTFNASQLVPISLSLTNKDVVNRDEARPVWTGNLLPQGADAVIMLEYTRVSSGRIEIWMPLTPGENVSEKGEDFREGEIAIRSGNRLTPFHIGLLAALGVTQINVRGKPKVALLSTGSELVDPLTCGKPKPTQKIDVNRLILSSMCLELGVSPVELGIARDNLDEICTKIREGVRIADLLITTGGTSVGHADLVPEAINRLGKPGVIVHGIAMRPGMPTALAILQGKPIIVLSGNPVAAIIGFEVFARPILLRLLGIESEPRPMLKARLIRRVPSVLGRRVFLRVHVFKRDGEFFADPVRIKGAGNLSTVTKANGYVVIPENLEGLDENEHVIVHLFDTIGGT